MVLAPRWPPRHSNQCSPCNRSPWHPCVTHSGKEKKTRFRLVGGERCPVGALHGMPWLLSPGGSEVAPTGHLSPPTKPVVAYVAAIRYCAGRGRGKAVGGSMLFSRM